MTLNKMTWPKILAAIAIAVVVGVIALFQFTSFQIPENLFSKSKPLTVGGGLKNVNGSTETRNNLDEVNDIIKGKKKIGDAAVTPTDRDQ